MPPNAILFCIFLVGISNINLARSMVCPPDVCSSTPCLAIKKCDANQVLKPGGFCNCCNQCVTILKKSEACGTSLQGIILGAPPPISECDQGLLCLDGICQKIKV